MPKIEIRLAEVPLDVLFRVEAFGAGLVLLRKNGSITAFEDGCPHAQWPLSEGELKDGILQCIGHGWEFDVQSGRCLTVPGCSLKLLPVTIDQDRVRIEWD
jgi:nitrite reductase/ring-hydroxylating ferredoxin subunit